MSQITTQCPIPSICGVTTHRTDSARTECQRKQTAVSGASKNPALRIDLRPSANMVADDFYEEDEVDTGAKAPHYQPIAHRPAFSVNEDLSSSLSNDTATTMNYVSTRIGGAVQEIWSGLGEKKDRPSIKARDRAIERLGKINAKDIQEISSESGESEDGVRDAIKTMTSVLRDQDKLEHMSAYVAARRMAYYQSRIEALEAKKAEYQEYLEGLDPQGTDGKFTYDLGQDAAVSFTPSRVFDQDLADEFLSDDQKAKVERTVTTYDSKRARALLEKDDPDTWEACRRQGTTRVSYDLGEV